MSTPLDQAIATAKKGDTQEAQQMLAGYLAATPDDDQAWYLMSQMVDSDARRAVYLGKTLALNPWHERAWAEFYSLPPDVISMLEASSTETPSATKGAAVATATAAAATVTADAALPDWLQPVVGDQPIAVQSVVTDTTKGSTMDPDEFDLTGHDVDAVEELQEGNQSLTIVLTLLLIATIGVLSYLVYLLLQG